LALRVYRQFPFIGSNEIRRVDTATADGGTVYPLTNNSSVNVGDTIQADFDYYSRALNGFSFPTISSVELSTAPEVGAQILIPGNTYLLFDVFDQVNVSGVDSPANEEEVTFYVADDGSDLTTQIYDPMPGTPGIGILFSNLVTAAGAQVSWMQLACADASGNVLTYQATGTTLYTAPLDGFTQLAASGAAGTTTLLTVSGSATSFYAGDFITLNPGGPNEEDVRITAKVSNTFTITGTNFDHSPGENIFTKGRQCYAKVTVPVGILNQVAANLINLGLQTQATLVSRL
jgi:hypothetical protein